VIANRKPIIDPGNDVADGATTTASRISKVMNARWVTARELRPPASE
jgi:hypothetical protein